MILLLFGDDLLLLLVVGEYDDELGRLLLYYLEEKIVVVDQMDCRYREPLQCPKIFPYDHDPSRIVLVMSLCRMMMDCALGSLMLAASEDMVSK